MKLTTCRLREGKFTPVMCDGKVVTEFVNFLFGSEKQDVYYCTKTDEVPKTEDSSLLKDSVDTAIYSARLKALPAKINGIIFYDSTLAMQPKIYKSINVCEEDINEAGGSATTGGDADAPAGSSCFGVHNTNENDLPKAIVDLSSFSIEMSNQGIATASVTVSAEKGSTIEAITAARTLFESVGLSNRQGTLYISSAEPTPSYGIDYIDFRITARGILT